jgi:hypothetical protein
VIAFQKNLVAAADAHHLMADFSEAGGGISSAEECEDSGTEQDGLEHPAPVPGELRFFVRVLHRLSGSGLWSWVLQP